ncbi:NAD(P)-dependent alcohol dehydrogenase [Sphingomonas sp. SUN019]|uniref:zinc-dependent alcohol dehydrogenase family protein n=1 Tax=Sphingomonas sp. SUN019 TaxID=2937788 RepID=UPI0021649301|nr:NAD(P)-dependent alcohol dehydrogenase [Sphingomonas sp. SUN019]UVO50670.1 NAD(P)-dependent alcohol dehydrogenase [Sphingomonas sp. SUN019]
MKTWRLAAGAGSLDDLALVEAAKPALGPGEVLIRVRACSLNYRDQLIVKGQYFGGAIDRDLTPLSDGAGEVEAVGEGVTAFAPGDRVAGTFFQNWLAGPPNPNPGVALGAPPAAGMLSEYVVLPERGVVPIAASLSFEEAATLPCAGVTAWNALMEGPRAVGPGRSVLVLGTGGVSLLALAIAKAAGARVVATSSSDEKLARIRALGADETINYRTTPDWGAAAATLAGGGVDHVVEVGGAGTLAQSMAAVGFNGEVALIGVLTRSGETGPHALMFKGASLRGIFVGSAAMAIALNRAIDTTGIKPAIDRVFAFDEARQAYDYQSSPDLFGKVVIRVD